MGDQEVEIHPLLLLGMHVSLAIEGMNVEEIVDIWGCVRQEERWVS